MVSDSHLNVKRWVLSYSFDRCCQGQPMSQSLRFYQSEYFPHRFIWPTMTGIGEVGTTMHIKVVFNYVPLNIFYRFRKWQCFFLFLSSSHTYSTCTRVHTHNNSFNEYLTSSHQGDNGVCVHVCAFVHTCACVTEGGGGGLSGQPEQGLIKKSIKKKQRRRGKRLLLLTAVSACKSDSSLSKWVPGLFAGKGRPLTKQRNPQSKITVFLAGTRYRIQFSPLTISLSQILLHNEFIK